MFIVDVLHELLVIKENIIPLFYEEHAHKRGDLEQSVEALDIAADEKERIKRHKNKENIVMPLVDIGWEEDLCGIEAACLSLLSPVYTYGSRDGCWFCHNQSIGQLRNLRKKYTKLWEILCKWDADSPVTFKADGHTVRDFVQKKTTSCQTKNLSGIFWNFQDNFILRYKNERRTLHFYKGLSGVRKELCYIVHRKGLGVSFWGRKGRKMCVFMDVRSRKRTSNTEKDGYNGKGKTQNLYGFCFV